MKLLVTRTIAVGVMAITLANCRCFGGTFSGRTTRLDPTEAAEGVTITALILDGNGNETGRVAATATSGAGGAYTINVGNNPRVKLLFEQGGLTTVLDKLVGTSSVRSLDVIVPKSIGRQPCMYYRRSFFCR